MNKTTKAELTKKNRAEDAARAIALDKEASGKPKSQPKAPPEAAPEKATTSATAATKLDDAKAPTPAAPAAAAPPSSEGAKVETPVDELKRIAESHESPAVRRAASRNLENMKADPSIGDKINSQFKPGEVTSKLESGISDQKNKLAKKVADERAAHGELDGRGKEFVKLYADKLMADPANDHVLDRDHAEQLAEYMTHSLKRGAGGIDSSAIKGVAKDLGIKHGVASIADHLTNGAYSAKKQAEKDAKANAPKKSEDEIKAQRQSAMESARNARSEAVLDKSVRHNGEIKTRRQWLADLHKEGYRVADTVHPNDKDGSFRTTNDGGNSFYNLTPTEAAHMRSLRAAEAEGSAASAASSEAKGAATVIG